MKNVFKKTGFVAMAGVLSLAVLFSACKKNDESQSVPVAALMAFNLAPDKNQAGFSLSGNSLTYSPLAYSSFTGYYINIYPGPRTVESYDQFGNISNTPFTFDVNKYYSVFLLGANGNYRNLVLDDKIDTLTAPGNVAYVRYLNAVPDSSKPVISITANGTTLVNNTTGFAEIADFIPVAPGTITVAASNEGTINTSREITVESRKVYTILLQGLPNDQSADRQVQIKYITNGTVQ